MNPHPSRPEDRCRSGPEQLASQTGSATGPSCFRSEGFAEDLPESGTLARRIGTVRQGSGGWSVLGLALAALLGVLGR
jgi:hypothetical protein